MEFRSKGKDAGFSFKEIEMLRQLTTQCGIEPPDSIFESQAQFDPCIRSLVRSIKMSGGNASAGNRDFLSKLYDYRQKIEIKDNPVQKPIADSREISEGQPVRVLLTGTGVFESQVVRNVGQYMTISRPVSNKGPSNSIAWANKKIAVYFSRENDAGYVFDSEVLDEVFSLGVSSLKITHGESLFRTQKRKSVRAKVNKPAFLYLVPFLESQEPSHKMEVEPGVKCILEDISDSGYAVAIGGKAAEGLRIKVQFALENVPVCITGTVRSTTYREEIDRTVLRVEAEPLPIETRNRILSEVFGMLPDEDEDDLPFRVMDDELAALNADADSPGSDAVVSSQADSIFIPTAENVSKPAKVTVTVRDSDGK